MGAYIVNLDEYESIGIHWIALYVNRSNLSYFDSFGPENIPEETKKFIGNKNVIKNIYRMQESDLIMCGYFCIGFIDFKWKVYSSIQVYFLLMIMKMMIK